MNWYLFSNLIALVNKPGTAQVGAISKAQKDSKTTFSTTGDKKALKKLKNFLELFFRSFR